jgi:hypothetical protein
MTFARLLFSDPDGDRPDEAAAGAILSRETGDALPARRS